MEHIVEELARQDAARRAQFRARGVIPEAERARIAALQAADAAVSGANAYLETANKYYDEEICRISLMQRQEWHALLEKIGKPAIDSIKKLVEKAKIPKKDIPKFLRCLTYLFDQEDLGHFMLAADNPVDLLLLIYDKVDIFFVIKACAFSGKTFGKFKIFYARGVGWDRITPEEIKTEIIKQLQADGKLVVTQEVQDAALKIFVQLCLLTIITFLTFGLSTHGIVLGSTMVLLAAIAYYVSAMDPMGNFVVKDPSPDPTESISLT